MQNISKCSVLYSNRILNHDYQALYSEYNMLKIRILRVIYTFVLILTLLKSKTSFQCQYKCTGLPYKCLYQYNLIFLEASDNVHSVPCAAKKKGLCYYAHTISNTTAKHLSYMISLPLNKIIIQRDNYNSLT